MKCCPASRAWFAPSADAPLPARYSGTAKCRGVKGGFWAPLSANPACAPSSRGEPRNVFPDCARTSECIPGWSENLGMYSRIERHGDRQTTGDWQLEVILRLGRKITSKNCQSPMLCLPSRAPDCWERGPRCRGFVQKFGNFAPKFWALD